MLEQLPAQAALTYGGALTAGFAGVLAAARGRPARLSSSVLFTRWRTWVVIAAIFVPAVLAGPPVLRVLLAAVSTVALLEYARLVGIGGGARLPLVLCGAAIFAGAGVATPLVFVTVLALALVATSEMASARELGAFVLGVVYIPLALVHALLMLGGLEGGAGLLLAVGLAIAMSDTGAFILGSTLRGPRLAPRISPGKRWSGLAGNLAGAAVALILARAVFLDVSVPLLAVLALVIAAAAVAGDLFESSLKRRAGVKDAAAWLPGFGGLLDRIDSVLFAIPAAFYVVLAFG